MAVSKAQAENQNTYLGQLWTSLLPDDERRGVRGSLRFILQLGRAGIENTIAFIVCGVFMFRFFERSVMAGAHSINKNLNLVRSVKFPRAVLPIAGVLTELTILLPAVVVMAVISYVSRFLPFAGKVTIDWYHSRDSRDHPDVDLLHRLRVPRGTETVALAPDLDNIIRTSCPCSCMPPASSSRSTGTWASSAGAGSRSTSRWRCTLYLVRSCLLNEPAYQPSLTMWLFGIGWAIIFAIVGFVVFWRAEAGADVTDIEDEVDFEIDPEDLDSAPVITIPSEQLSLLVNDLHVTYRVFGAEGGPRAAA